MSTPIRSEDRMDNSLLYAPPWARESPTGEPEGRRLPNSPPMAPGIGGPNIDLPPPRAAPFEGDIAIKELRRRLSLEPELVPEPPVPLRRRTVAPGLVRFLLMAAAASIVAYGAALLSFSDASRVHLVKRETASAAVVAPLPAKSPSELRRTLPLRFVMEGRHAFTNEPLPLGISLNGTSDRESLLITGLAAGTQLSAGRQFGSTAWRVPAREVGTLLAYAPKDFVGAMDAAVDLRSPRDALVDSQLVRLEWIAKQAHRNTTPDVQLGQGHKLQSALVIQQLDPEELATLLRRGRELLEQGDIAAARLMLRRAADAGNAQAALSFGATYDPRFLVELGVLGLSPDVAKARVWYQRAKELGSDEASRRIERLAHAPL